MGTSTNPKLPISNVARQTAQEMGLQFSQTTVPTTVPGAVTITRPENTDAYAVKDIINTTSGVITGASNTNPIVITTSAAHGLVDRQPVTIASVGGNTNANGNYFAKLITATTFSIWTDATLQTARVGNAAYTSGGSTTTMGFLPDIFRDVSGAGFTVKVFILNSVETNTWKPRIHLFSSPITAIADNAAMPLLFASRASYIGSIDLVAFTTEDTTAGDSGSTIWTPGKVDVLGNVQGVLAVKNGTGTRDLYFHLETQDIFTPTSLQQFYVEITIENNQTF